MKYLVNLDTKEHVIYNYGMSWCQDSWRIVEADAEGWIEWDGGECPLPDDCMCEIKTPVVSTNIRAKIASEWIWGGTTFEWSRITHYRPILDKPTVKESLTVPAPEYDPRSVSFNLIDRLKSAHEAAQSIPDLLAELREALGPELLRMLTQPESRAGMSFYTDGKLHAHLPATNDISPPSGKPSAWAAAPDVETLKQWLRREMPAGTVIGDPAWWAPKIINALNQAKGDN